MAHSAKDQKKLVARVRRIRGQINAVETALGEGRDCATILQTVAACRGALNALMSELVTDHVRFHVLGSKRTRDQSRAAEELIRLVKSYLK